MSNGDILIQSCLHHKMWANSAKTKHDLKLPCSALSRDRMNECLIMLCYHLLNIFVAKHQWYKDPCILQWYMYIETQHMAKWATRNYLSEICCIRIYVRSTQSHEKETQISVLKIFLSPYLDLIWLFLAWPMSDTEWYSFQFYNADKIVKFLFFSSLHARRNVRVIYLDSYKGRYECIYPQIHYFKI